LPRNSFFGKGSGEIKQVQAVNAGNGNGDPKRRISGCAGFKLPKVSLAYAYVFGGVLKSESAGLANLFYDFIKGDVVLKARSFGNVPNAVKH
jgi:hypothetical protein